MKPNFLALTGPTASGKTSWAIELHEEFGWPIFSFDSRQFYRELKIGVARPTQEELQRAPHYFIADRSVTEPLSSGSFAVEVWNLIDTKSIQNVILVGGSGLYLKAVLEGFDQFPEISKETKGTIAKGFEEGGIRWLQENIESRDPKKFSELDSGNPQRMMRVLGILMSGEKPFSHWENSSEKRDFSLLSVAPLWERETLYSRINSRVDSMMEMGLLKEVSGLKEHRHLSTLQTVGYKELFNHLDGQLTLEEATDLIKRNSRRYAKRQLTWFRNQEPETKWLDPQTSLLESPDILDFVQKPKARVDS